MVLDNQTTPKSKSSGVAMNQTAPHYLLLCESNSVVGESGRGGRWSFVLEQLGGSRRVEVAEREPGVFGERLELLAVVRGLEALEQSSIVTLVTSSSYVGRGIRRNLATWRENGFQWERFGHMTPIKNQDLWKRVSRALEFHRVECRIWSFSRRLSSEFKLKLNAVERDRGRVSDRWETSTETQEFGQKLIATNDDGFSMMSEHSSDKEQTTGLRRSYECAAS
jgi:ribonuclease HI